jgi:uncharacterized membrane protein YphA (DoxX/SURF4 family)
MNRLYLLVPARWILGAILLWLGLAKALDPVGFMKLVREYQVVGPPLLTVIPALLPWFEVYCGLLLLCGIAVRGAAVVAGGLLAAFSLLILQRAWGIHEAQSIAFCAIRFDCGCGGGAVNICFKLFQNILLLGLSALVVLVPCPHCAWRYELRRAGP